MPDLRRPIVGCVECWCEVRMFGSEGFEEGGCWEWLVLCGIGLLRDRDWSGNVVSLESED